MRFAGAFAMVAAVLLALPTALLAIPAVASAETIGAVTGRLWDDVDRDGFQDGAEKRGVGGLTLQLRTHPENTIVTTTTSAGDGSYRLAPTEARAYRIQILLPSSIAMSLTTDEVTDEALDSDFLRGGSSEPFTLGADDLTLDGAVRLQQVTVRLYLDQDGDGRPDLGEPGIRGVTVKLLMSIDLSITVTTGKSDELGDVRLVIPLDRLENTFRAKVIMPDTYARNAGIAPDVDDHLDKRNLSQIVIRGDELELGLFRPVRLGDRVWRDRDLDGRQDTGEPGIAGVLLTLLDAETDSPIRQVTTDANGRFRFVAPVPGRYRVWVSADAGTRFSPMRSDLPEEIDSDVRGRLGGALSPVLKLVVGKDRRTFDVGMRP
jgi:hypothetical protein